MTNLRRDFGVNAHLRDGATARIRSVNESDVIALRAMYQRVSDDALYLRFFVVSKLVVARDIAALTRQADDDHGSLLAEVGDRIVGVATFERQLAEPDLAEIALLVSDDYRGQGVGTLLLSHLAELAASFGIERFFAETLTINSRMLRVLADAGLRLPAPCAQDVTRVEFPVRSIRCGHRELPAGDDFCPET